jgi:hypothetical protein
MTKKDKIKEYDILLQKYIDKKSYVKIYRTIYNKEESLSGFILGMSKQFLFLQLDSDFMFDGYAIIRKDDFDYIRHSSYEKAQRKIFKGEGLLDNEYGLDKKLSLTSWTEIINTLKSFDFHIIIESLKKDYVNFWIGEIETVSDKTVSIHNYNPDGQLDGKTKSIKLKTISTLHFGDRYSTIFRKYLKPYKKAK